MESFLPPLTNIVFEICSFFLGAALGSFAGLCSRRIPSGSSIIFPGSRCEDCETPIRAFHNIPLLSWVCLGGKCAYCGKRIPIEYPLTELLCAALSLSLYLKFGLCVEFFFYLALCVSLVIISSIDIKHLIIPDVITLPGIVLGIVFGVLQTDWMLLEASFSSGFIDFLSAAVDIPIFNSLGGMLLGGGSFFLIARVYKSVRKKEGMGMGDVKLISMLGAFLGMWGVLVVIFISSLLGTLAGVLVIIARGKSTGYAIAYGPFLSISAILYLFGQGMLAFE